MQPAAKRSSLAALCSSRSYSSNSSTRRAAINIGAAGKKGQPAAAATSLQQQRTKGTHILQYTVKTKNCCPNKRATPKNKKGSAALSLFSCKCQTRFSRTEPFDCKKLENKVSAALSLFGCKIPKKGFSSIEPFWLQNVQKAEAALSHGCKMSKKLKQH